MSYRYPRLALTFLLLCLSVPLYAHATIFHVDAAVAPGNSCAAATSVTTPRKTIAAGIACLSAGDTLIVHGGTYNERIHPADYHLPSGTSWSTPITIQGAAGETATIIQSGNKIQDNLDNSVVQYLIFDHLTFAAPPSEEIQWEVGGNSAHIRLSNSNLVGSPGIWIVNTVDDIQIVGNYIHDMPSVFAAVYGLTLGSYGSYTNGSHVLFDGNTFQNVSGYCIHNYWSGHAVNGTIIRNNTFINCGYDDGQRDNGTNVVIMAGADNLFYNNLVYNNVPVRGSSVLSISAGAGPGTGNKVWNNTFYNNAGAAVEVNVGTSGTEIRNNLFYLNTGGIQDDSSGLAGIIQDHNQTGDPSFVSPGAGNFQLQQGSPAIDAGIPIAQVTTDIRGLARLQGAAPDLGAYEYGGSVITAGPQALRWKFDEGAGTTVADATGNAYTGTLVAGPLWGPGRVGGGAVTMNGTTQYVTTTTMVWTAGQPVTVLLWRKVTAGGVTGAFGAHSTAVQDRFGAHLPYSDNTCYWDYGDWHTVGRVSVDCTPYLGRWVRFALVSSGATSSFRGIYANGALLASAPSSTAPLVDLTVFDVGRWVNESGTYYDPGSVDDFRLDSRVWSAAEILTDYRQSATVRRHRVSMR
jgi:hypothetical protein